MTMAELDEIREILGIDGTDLSAQQVIYTMQDRIQRQDAEIEKLRLYEVMYQDHGKETIGGLMARVAEADNLRAVMQDCIGRTSEDAGEKLLAALSSGSDQKAGKP